MRRNLFLILAASISLLSCSKDFSNPSLERIGYYDSVVMSVQKTVLDSDIPITKNIAVITDKGVNYIWAETDTVGIFPSAGSQLFFSMSEGAGKTDASFDGGGWALKSESNYYSYFPFVPDFNIDKGSIPFDYRGQKQDGNGSNITGASGNIGKYCFMAAKGNATQSGSLYFDYKRIGALFILTVPAEAGSYESATVLVDSKVIPFKGTFNAVTVDQKMYNTEVTDTVSIKFNNLTLTSKGLITFYMMLPPFNYLDRQFSIVTTKTDGTTAISSFAGKDFSVEKTYLRNTNFSVSPASIGVSNVGGTENILITCAGSSNYSVTTDVDWITLNSHPTSGDATITATISSNSGYRTGHIIVSETVSPNGTPVTLRNSVTVSQNPTGYSVGIGDWGKGHSESGEAH